MSRNKDQYRLWQHPNGTIYVTWTVRTKTEPGQTKLHTKRVSTGTNDWAAAEKYRAQFIAGLSNQIPQEEPTIGYILDRYRDEHGVNTRSFESLDYGLKMLRPFFGNLLPSHVTNALLRQFAAENRESSDGTILRRLGILKSALRYAEGNRWIAPLPVFKMPVSQPPPRDLWLTREQVNVLIENAKSPHIELFIKLALSTAARSGAILDLTWSQVNFESRIIDFGKGWGNKRRAIVPINNDLYDALTVAKELAQTDHVIEFHGKRLASIKIAFARLCRNCGMRWMALAGQELGGVKRGSRRLSFPGYAASC